VLHPELEVVDATSTEIRHLEAAVDRLAGSRPARDNLAGERHEVACTGIEVHGAEDDLAADAGVGADAAERGVVASPRCRCREPEEQGCDDPDPAHLQSPSPACSPDHAKAGVVAATPPPGRRD
jgi:hypothetical protein